MKLRDKFKQMSKKEKRYFIIKYGILVVYIMCVLVLCVESLMPGNVSSEHSDKVGEIVNVDVDRVVELTSINIAAAEGSLKSNVSVGDSFTLMPVYTPKNATYKQVNWSLSDDKIAYMQDDNIIFTAAGKVTVTVTSEYYSNITASYEFTVSAVNVQSIKINNVIKDPLIVGQTIDLSATVLPYNAENRNYIFTSDSDCVTVSGRTLTAVKQGNATITASCVADPTITDKITVTVKNIAVESLEFQMDGSSLVQLDLHRGQTSGKITVLVSPQNATNKELIWQVDDGVEISFTSLTAFTVNATNIGNFTVTAISKDNEAISASFTVSVTEMVAEDIIYTVKVGDAIKTGDNIVAYVGDKIKIDATAAPEDVAYKAIEFSVNTSSGLTVNKSGNITATKAGNYTVTLKCDNITKTIEFTIKSVDVVGIQITSNGSVVTDLNIDQGQKMSLAVKFTTDPLNKTPTDKGVKWQSSAANIVSVTSSGIIQGLKKGSATITCTHNSGKSAQITVNVTEQETVKIDDIKLILDGVSYSGNNIQNPIELKTGKDYNIGFIASINNVETETPLSYSASDNVKISGGAGGNILFALNEDYTLHALYAGNATITMYGGDIERTFILNISDIAVIGLTIGFTPNNVRYGDEIDLQITLLGEDGDTPTATVDDVEYIYDIDSFNLINHRFVAKKLGTVKITAKYGDISDSIEFMVSSNLVGLVAENKTMFVGENYSVNYTTTTTNNAVAAPFKHQIAVIEGFDVVNINAEGVVVARKAGVAKIQISIDDTDIEAIVLLTVNDILIENIVIYTPTEINIGKEIALGYDILPKNASAKKIVWSSDDETVASVTSDGILRFLKAGSVVITALAEKGSAAASLALTAYNVLHLSSIKATGFDSFSGFTDRKATAVLKRNSGAHLSFIFGNSATYKKITVLSSNENILSVSGNTVTAKKAGNATITMIYWDGDEKIEPIVYTIEVTVTKQKLSDVMGNWGRTIRKGLGHFGAFLVMGIFAALTYMLFIKKRYIAAPITFIAGFAVAGLTEFFQKLVPNRGPSFADVLLDFQGFCFSAIPIVITFIIISIVKFVKNKKNNNNDN